MIKRRGHPVGSVISTMHASAYSAWSFGRQHIRRRYLFLVFRVSSSAHARCRGKVCESRKGCRDVGRVSGVL